MIFRPLEKKPDLELSRSEAHYLRYAHWITRAPGSCLPVSTSSQTARLCRRHTTVRSGKNPRPSPGLRRPSIKGRLPSNEESSTPICKGNSERVTANL